MAFSFGTAAKPTFGSTATTSASTGFSFGTQPATTQTGFGNFGSTATGTATGFGFGTKPVTTTASGFGQTGFGFGTATAPTGTTGLGPTGFSFGTNTAATTSSGFGGGTGFGSFGGFGSTTTTASTGLNTTVTQNAPSDLSNMAAAVSMPVLFGDERDAVLTKWNQLQAFWGSGKGFYNQQGAFVNLTPENPFCRFKAVGYSIMPSTSDTDGLVAIVFKKKLEDIQANQTQVVDSLQRILGNKPNVSVCVECVKALPEDKCEMQIYIQERLQTGTTARISATNVFNFMNQQTTRTQLQSQLMVENLFPKTGMSRDVLKAYLDNPPAGIDPLIWQQAKLDNPDPEQFIPVPMVGFSELHHRLQHQEDQTKRQQARLQMVSSDIATLQRDHANMLAKTEEYKRRHLELSHRVLQVLVKQEISRKMGYAIQADEEQLRVQLEALQQELNAPTQFKGRLNELMSQIRMQNQLGGGRLDASYQIDEAVQIEIRQHLKQQQDGLKHLISIIKDDLEDLKLIETGLTEPLRR